MVAQLDHQPLGGLTADPLELDQRRGIAVEDGADRRVRLVIGQRPTVRVEFRIDINTQCPRSRQVQPRGTQRQDICRIV